MAASARLLDFGRKPRMSRDSLSRDNVIRMQDTAAAQ
jgi:hypothetical protein